MPSTPLTSGSLAAALALLGACTPGTDDAGGGDTEAFMASGSTGSTTDSSSTGQVTPTTDTGDPATNTTDTDVGSTTGSTEAGEADTTGSTTDFPIPPNCGDGILELGVEECDDGNEKDDDACSNECKTALLAFGTYETYFGGELGGIEEANAKCQWAATLAELPGAEILGTYRAWLADFTTAPKFSFPKVDNWFVTTGQVNYPIAKGTAGLMGGQLVGSINFNEYGVPMGTTYVWTNVKKDGDRSDIGLHCGNWNSIDAGFGVTGTSQKKLNVNTWTEDLVVDCGTKLPIYCFQVNTEQQQPRE